MAKNIGAYVTRPMTLIAALLGFVLLLCCYKKVTSKYRKLSPNCFSYLAIN